MSGRPGPALVAGLCLLAGGVRAYAFMKTWQSVQDLSGGAFYGIECEPPVGLPTDPAHLTITHQTTFAPETGGNTNWDSSTLYCSWLPYDVGLQSTVVMGNTIFVISGDAYTNPGFPPGNCSHGCNATLAFVQAAWVDPATGILGVINPATGSPGPWATSPYFYGQTVPTPKVGVPTKSARAVVVGTRVYVVGGDTRPCGSSPPPGTKAANTNVFSATIDPAAGGNLGLWEAEPSLTSPTASFGLVYAAGALYAIGGMTGNADNDPQQVVQKAEVLPDGHLSTWTFVASVPSGQPPVTSNPCSIGWCQCLPGACPDNAKCLVNNPCIGWDRLNAFSTLNSIGFIGAEFRPIIGSAPAYNGTMDGWLDDCNNVSWTDRVGKDAIPDAGILLKNGQLILLGGKTNSVSPQHIWNSGTQQAIVRTGLEGTVLQMVPADGTLLKRSTPSTPEEFPATSPPPTPPPGAPPLNAPSLVSVGNWVYEVGNSLSGSVVCGRVWRAPLGAATWWLDSGAYVSPPYDMGAPLTLKRVEWAFDKSGGKNDDWMILKYRVAGPNMQWSCWTPRTPDVGAAPTAPGHYVYSSDAAKEDFREPLNTSCARYIQFKIDFYNDGSTDGGIAPTLPVFDYFAVAADPCSVTGALTSCLAVYPDPARDQVTFAFNVVGDGSEVVIRIYDVAGHLVDKETFHYATGGTIHQPVLVNQLQPGAYLARLESRSTGGGDGFVCPGDNPRLPNTTRTAKGKFVVRR